MPNINMDIAQTLSRLWNNWKIIRAHVNKPEQDEKFFNSLLETYMVSEEIVNEINRKSSDGKGIDWSKKDMYEGIGRPDLKPSPKETEDELRDTFRG